MKIFSAENAARVALLIAAAAVALAFTLTYKIIKRSNAEHASFQALRARNAEEVLNTTLRQCKESGGRLFIVVGTGVSHCEWTPNEGLGGQ